jgi:hypothetical protein
MTVAHDSLAAAVRSLEVCMFGEKIRNLGLNCLRKQRTRSLP